MLLRVTRRVTLKSRGMGEAPSLPPPERGGILLALHYFHFPSSFLGKLGLRNFFLGLAEFFADQTFETLQNTY